MILSSRHHVTEVAFVVFLLSQALDTGHQHVIVTQEILQDELRHGVAKAGVGVGVEDLDVYRDVEPLPGGWGEPEEANLQAVLHDVLVLRPHDLGQLPQVGDLRVQQAVNNRKIKTLSSPPSRNVL